ncbi:MAG TPA: aspartyl-phosphate phosphatase Spo0E family protein [Symbiobacteriaceae bacterium]|nr:aspartyl-phosphate phosphatase Spo0E family protein [Symbiobacteriaceae bacterium]
MTTSARVLQEIEELRRQLHKGLGSRYDPIRLQALAPISQELDRLAVELGRQQLTDHREAAVVK